MGYYGARVTRNKDDMEENTEEEEDIFVEMRHVIQVILKYINKTKYFRLRLSFEESSES